MLAFLIALIAIVLIILIVTLWKRSPKRKGNVGELKVSSMLEEFGGYIYNDYYVLDDIGKLHQIDHVLVCSKGIVVVETKNYSGQIYGDDYALEWTQVLQDGYIENKFYSPVKQNNSHIYQISRITKKKWGIISLVIFVQGNVENISSNCVYTIDSAREHLLNQNDVLGESDIEKIVEILDSNRVEEVSKKDHVKQIKKTIEDIENNICPRCGKPLVLRNGKYGDFWGCSGYPKCKFKKKR